MSLNPRQKVDIGYAIACAEAVLPIFSAWNTKDNRPQQAIDVARKFLESDGTIGTAHAAFAAYAAADAAAAATYTTYAAHAAAAATYAAYAAADAATDTTYTAAHAAAAHAAYAAYAAAYAGSPVMRRQLEWLKLDYERKCLNLTFKCHFLVGKRYCNSQLDEEGQCSRHGLLTPPGEATLA